MDEYRADRRRLIGAGVVLAGAGMAAACSSRGQADAAASPAWEPTPEKLDSWLDKPGTRHRMVIDTTSGGGGQDGVGYAIHFIYANQRDYDLKPEQLGLVLVFRHGSTAYGYNNAIWTKYGKRFAGEMKLTGELAKYAATMNPLLAKPTTGGSEPKGMEWAAGPPLTALAARGVRFAVCGLATEGIAGDLAGKNGNAKAIEAELRANLVPGAVMVPAGVVAVNRAQEHGYTFAYTG